jgi:hypothetical protein
MASNSGPGSGPATPQHNQRCAAADHETPDAGPVSPLLALLGPRAMYRPESAKWA